jgi:hypothetical protein
MMEWRYRPTILDLGTRRSCVASFTPRLLYPQRRSTRYTLNRRLDGPQSRSGRCREDKQFLPLPWIELLTSSPSLYRLRYVLETYFHLGWFSAKVAYRNTEQYTSNCSSNYFFIPYHDNLPSPDAWIELLWSRYSRIFVIFSSSSSWHYRNDCLLKPCIRKRSRKS